MCAHQPFSRSEGKIPENMRSQTTHATKCSSCNYKVHPDGGCIPILSSQKLWTAPTPANSNLNFMGQRRPYLLGMRFGGYNLLCCSLNDFKPAPNPTDRGGKSERTQTCNAALRWERDMLPPCAVALCRCACHLQNMHQIWLTTIQTVLS